MTIKQALYEASKEISLIDAKILLKYLLNVNEQYLVINLNNELIEYKKYKELVEEIKNGKPLQYITHKQDFMGFTFYVDENVLIPQPDTEILVQETLKLAYDKKNIKILDLCTGSGAIAISLKALLGDDAEVYASDISENALSVAKKNAKKLKQDIKFIQSDMFKNIQDSFDIIVSNPPYIETGIIKTLSKDVQAEPIIALDGGIDGLDFYRKIHNEIDLHLNGTLLLEIGYNQKENVLKIFEEGTCIKDYAGNDRVIIWNHSHQK